MQETPAESVELSKTYQDTLAFINQGLTIDQVSQERALAVATILGHIHKLTQNRQLTPKQQAELFAQVPTNPELDALIEKAINLTGSVQSFSSYMAIFRQLRG